MMCQAIDPEVFFETIVSSTTDALVGVDQSGCIILFNPAAEEMFQCKADTVTGKNIECLMPDQYRHHHGDYVSAYFNRQEQRDLVGKPRRMFGKRADQTEFPIEISLARSPVQATPFVLAIIRDVGEQVEAGLALKKSRERYVRAVEGSRDGIWDWDLTTNTIYYSPRWRELLGISEQKFGDTPEDWFKRILPSSLKTFRRNIDEHVKGLTAAMDTELEMRHEDGSIRWMLCRGVAARDQTGEVTNLSGSLADVTELKDTQEQLRQRSDHDRLTNLPNRSVLTARIADALEKTRENPNHFCALLFFDFDRFKHVNDGLGHAIGDALLISIAERLKEHVHKGDTVSRFGGDEFVVLLDGVTSMEEVKSTSAMFLSVLAEPHRLQSYEIVSTASIGVTTSRFGYDHPNDMIRDADAAMYQAKASGKNRYQFFDKQMHAQSVQQFKVEQDLQRMPFNTEFCLHYQPIVALESGKIAGFEALVRWDHPQSGMLYPDCFISIAEETGLVVPLGEWVLRTACQQIVQWRTEVCPEMPLFMNVNVSRRQLAHPKLLKVISETIELTGVRPADLVLEITESAVMDDRQNVLPIMEDIRSMGISMAMDDFGTGQSSLSCLHRFPIDMLKIDRDFITNLEYRREFSAVIQSVLMLAKNLNMSVTAEGVESQGQLAQLQSMDCDYAQGYLFAKPLPSEEATAYLLKSIK